VKVRSPGTLRSHNAEARRLFLNEIHESGKYIEVKKCPYCGHDAFRKISETDRRGLPSDVVICEKCGGCFKSAILDDEANAFHYENISYMLRGKTSDRHAMESLFQERVRKLARPRFNFINNFVELTPGHDLIAEFGCNDGANLVPWKEKGFDTIGIDLDPAIIEFGRSKGLDLACGDFLNYDFSGKRPGLVILSHMLEHVADIDLVLQKLRGIISPDGYLFIESPGIRVHGLGNALAYFDIEHNYNFDLASLRRLLTARSFNNIYEDEYIRVICSLNRNLISKCHGERGMPSEAGIIKGLMDMMPYQKMELEALLRKSEDGNIGIKIFNRLQRLYYRRWYSSVSR